MPILGSEADYSLESYVSGIEVMVIGRNFMLHRRDLILVACISPKKFRLDEKSENFLQKNGQVNKTNALATKEVLGRPRNAG